MAEEPDLAREPTSVVERRREGVSVPPRGIGHDPDADWNPFEDEEEARFG